MIDSATNEGLFEVLIERFEKESSIRISQSIYDQDIENYWRQAEKFILDGKPLAFGYYPAREPLEIPLEGFSDPGLYHVELGARLRSGASTTLSSLLYHAG